MTGRQGRTTADVPDNRKPQGSARSGSLPFTFVHQHEDLKSVADRRIHSEAQRHEIRSHVMRGVRHQEQAQGKKRPTGRGSSRSKSNERSATLTRRSSSTSDYARSPVTAIQEESPNIDSFAFPPTQNALVKSRSASSTAVAGNMISGYQQFDLYESVPDTGLSAESVESLMQYCFTTMIPMTFPVESKQTNEQLARKNTILDAKLKRPATFYGFLAIAAAHRAILYGHHRDLSPLQTDRTNLLNNSDFKLAHNEAVRATRRKVQASEVTDSDFVEACFALIGAATVVGNFAEAKTHLNAVRQAVRTIEIPAMAQSWLPLADVKAALGMLSRPVVPLPWPRRPIDPLVLSRISPRPNMPMAQLGSAFRDVPNISISLRQLIHEATAICHLCQLNESSPEGLSQWEHVIYRCKALEAEYDLLKYVFDVFPHKEEDPATLVIPALEQVVRLAILGLLSIISCAILPASGLGRALTLHHKMALSKWCTSTASMRPDVAELRLVTWALFFYIQGAAEQDEAPEFETLLAATSRDLWLMSWEEVETTMYGFLYVPSVQRPSWRKIWEHVEEIHEGGKRMKGKGVVQPQPGHFYC